MSLRFAAIVSFLLLIFSFLTLDADAQRKSPYSKKKNKGKSISNYRGSKSAGGSGRFRPYNFLEGNINALNYYGDLAPVNRAGSSDVSFTRPGFGFSYGIRFNPAVAFRASYNYGLLKGDDFTADPKNPDDSPRYYRNLSFRNNINEITAGFMFFLFPDYHSASFRTPINVYLFLGGGFFRHSPKGKVPEFDYQTGSAERLPKAGEWVSLRDLGTEGQFLDIPGTPNKPYKRYEWNIPIALGGTMMIPGTPMNVSLELGYRMVFTDYLDDVSGRYVGLDQFTDPLARIMSDRSAEPNSAFKETEGRDLSTIVANRFPDGSIYNISGYIGSGIQDSRRGNPKENDMYFMTQIKLVYILQSNSGRRPKYR